MQVAVTVTHLGRFWTKSELLSTLLALQCILLVFRLQYFTQSLRRVRFAFLPISERARCMQCLCPCRGNCISQPGTDLHPQTTDQLALARLPAVKEVWGELRPYFYFMLIIMWGFACAFNIALRHDQEEQEVRPLLRLELVPGCHMRNMARAILATFFILGACRALHDI